jgi:hypothetical protein
MMKGDCKMIARFRPTVCSIVCAWVAAILAFSAAAGCEEGMWLPYSLPDEVMGELYERGMKLTRDEIHNPSGTGIANAVVGLGATGSFVSPEGLILTNHHVAFGAVQRISTPQRNYIEEGFLARSRDEEVPAHGYIAYVLLASEDVTPRVMASTRPSMSPRRRHDAIERATKEIVLEVEEGRDVYCEINAFHGGAQYILDTYLKLPDVRVVYVPSRSIGEYGGDIDNWMWPRHTGDFSFLRAYVGPDGRPAEYSGENVPYQPSSYLKIAAEGLQNGDFAMIIGYPRRTNRYLTSYGLAYRRDFAYPEHVRLYGEMLKVLEEQSKADPEAAVRVASRVKGINNRLKNNLGMLEGFANFDLVERQAEKEKDFHAALEGDPVLGQKYGGVLESLRDLYQERLGHARSDLILDLMLNRAVLLGQAMTLYKWSIEKEKEDIERDPGFMDREIPYLKIRLRVFQMGFHPESDRKLMSMYIHEILDLPENQRIEVIDDMFRGKSGTDLTAAVEDFLDRLYAGTRLQLPQERLRMFELSHDALVAERDAFIEFAAQIYDANEARIDREKTFEGAMTMLRPKWIEAQAEISGRTLYPDANGTMRLNYGVVKGYSPKEGIYYEPFTTLKEVAVKHTGVPPFNCPERLLELARRAEHGPYGAPALGDVPVNFLTTHDSTGGNSGSPVVNARGELVGCLFDGNYEAMTSDFLFMDHLTRSISVDIRYILFVADRVDGAQNILQELGLD